MNHIRRLRYTYGITTKELAQMAKISQQRMSVIELSDNPTEHMQGLMDHSFRRVIAERKKDVLQLEADFEACRLYLFEKAEEFI
jgi:hypothetical protein